MDEKPKYYSVPHAIAELLRLPASWITEVREEAEFLNSVRDYYRGKHPVKLNETMKNILQMHGAEYWFGVNYCRQIVDEAANRLNLEAVKVEEDESLQEYLDHAFERNDFELLQSDIHLAALRDGDVFLVCEWDSDEDELVYSLNYRYNGRIGVIPIYRNGELHSAAKVIETGEHSFEVILYSASSVLRFTFDGDSGLQPIGGDAWDPGVLPVVQFSNRRILGEQYGDSELRSMLGLQDALNATVITAIGAGYLSGFPTSVWKGGTESDPPKSIGPGTMVTLQSDDPAVLSSAGFEWNDSPDFSSTIRLITDFVLHISNVTGTPIKAGTDDQLTGKSGEAQKESSSKLLSKIKRARTKFSSEWKKVVHISVKAANSYGNKGFKEPKILTARWSDPEIRNNLEVVDIWRVIYDAIFPLNPELAGQLFLRGTAEITKLNDSEIEGFDLSKGLMMEMMGNGQQAANSRGTSGSTGSNNSGAGGGGSQRGSAKEGKRGTPSNSEQLKGRGGRSKDARGGR